MITKTDLAKIALVAQARPVAAALNELLNIAEESGGVLPEEVYTSLVVALATLEGLEDYLFEETYNGTTKESE